MLPSEHFSDCFYGDWFVDSGVVDYVFDHGYITGYAGTTLFGPANGLRRSEAVTILWRVAGKPQVASEKPQFDDANYEDFYGQALTWAREAGVVNGWDGTNDFAPDMEVSREQLAKMIANYANKIVGANTAVDQSNLDIFDDADAISPWGARCGCLVRPGGRFDGLARERLEQCASAIRGRSCGDGEDGHRPCARRSGTGVVHRSSSLTDV